MIAQELVTSGLLGRTHIGLDFFDYDELNNNYVEKACYRVNGKMKYDNACNNGVFHFGYYWVPTLRR